MTESFTDGNDTLAVQIAGANPCPPAGGSPCSTGPVPVTISAVQHTLARLHLQWIGHDDLVLFRDPGASDVDADDGRPARRGNAPEAEERTIENGSDYPGDWKEFSTGGFSSGTGFPMRMALRS